MMEMHGYGLKPHEVSDYQPIIAEEVDGLYTPVEMSIDWERAFSNAGEDNSEPVQVMVNIFSEAYKLFRAQSKGNEAHEEKFARNDKDSSLPLNSKFNLTIPEAVRYFGIGEKKLRKLINANQGAEFILMNGTKVLIKREKFERFCNSVSSI